MSQLSTKKWGSQKAVEMLQGADDTLDISTVTNNEFIKYLPDLIDLYFVFHHSESHEKIFMRIFGIFDKIATKKKVQGKHRDLMISLIKLITDYSYNKEYGTIEKTPQKFKDKITIFFTDFLPVLVPTMAGKIIFAP